MPTQQFIVSKVDIMAGFGNRMFRHCTTLFLTETKTESEIQNLLCISVSYESY